ncbi:MAG: D-glycero-beta-D-manno-heptose 1-phosphate adenylyltransferase [Bacteroidales bacterium]|nr:D-glycero-beta-D-manno-heptose 1-phosphate adenylyltransferase [Bacteroidales bacterium]
MKKLDIIKSKIFISESIERQVAIWRFAEKKVVFTNGCFDILHLGHIEYLSKAADFGNILIIGLNTDNSARRLKGIHRPINDENSRAIVLASLSFVNAIILFDEDTPYNLIRLIQPDILVKGSDYKIEDIVGYDIVSNNGGEIITIDFLPGYSTSLIEEKIKAI